MDQDTRFIFLYRSTVKRGVRNRHKRGIVKKRSGKIKDTWECTAPSRRDARIRFFSSVGASASLLHIFEA